VEHNHGYPHLQLQDDDPKHEEPEASDPPPSALQCPGQAEHCQNVLQPLAVNIPAHPQCEHRVPLYPGNVYGEWQRPIEQLRDIKGASQWRETVGEAPRPPQPDTPDHVPGGFPDTSATPSEEDVQKMCEEGGANLVHFLMGKALTTREPQYESVRNWSYKDIACLPKLSRNFGNLLAKESSTCCESTKSLS